MTSECLEEVDGGGPDAKDGLRSGRDLRAARVLDKIVRQPGGANRVAQRVELLRVRHLNRGVESGRRFTMRCGAARDAVLAREYEPREDMSSP